MQLIQFSSSNPLSIVLLIFYSPILSDNCLNKLNLIQLGGLVFAFVCVCVWEWDKQQTTLLTAP